MLYKAKLNMPKQEYKEW